MAWKDNTAHIRIRRRYHCDVCDHTFDMRHDREDEPMPDCPNCVKLGQEAAAVTWVPPLVAIGTTKGKAIDLAYDIAENDYGMTDMKDNQQIGDIAYVGPPPIQTAQAEAEIRQMVEAAGQIAQPLPQGPLAPDGTRQLLVDKALQVENFFQGNQGGSAEGTIGQAAAAKAASDQARVQGVDPVGILEKGRASGNMPFKLNVMSAVASRDLPEALQQAQARNASGG